MNRPKTLRVNGPRPQARKLTWEQAQDLRRRRENGDKYASLAADFNIPVSSAFNIANRITYRDPA